MDTNELNILMKSRADTYKLLARLWIKEIDAPLWEGLKNTTFPNTQDLPNLNSAYQKLEAYIAAQNPNTLTELKADYAALCASADPKKGADPYESVHRNSHGLLMQDQWETVLKFYRAAGLKRAPNSTEPEDHLGLELECMARLCQMPVDQRTIDMQTHLLKNHLLQWVPSFAKRVGDISNTEFYKALAIITDEYLKMDYEFVSGVIFSFQSQFFS